MHTYTDANEISADHKESFAVLGNFDGVHLGHRQLIREVVERAADNSAPSLMIAFEPHPREFLRQDEPPFRLTSLNIKCRILRELGLTALYCLKFDEALSRLSAEEFVSRILSERLALSALTVGYDFRFGAGRAGDTELLNKLAPQYGFELNIVEPIKDDGASGGVVYSSSNIRDALRGGDISQANKWLGRAWCIDGIVQKGDQRGRTIGFPTLNIPIGDYLRPALGVYAVKVEVEGEAGGVFGGVANLGKRPTFDKSDILLEAHIFDFDREIYGTHAIIHFVEFIRGEQKFDGIESLKQQIQADSQKAREILAAPDLPTIV